MGSEGGKFIARADSKDGLHLGELLVGGGLVGYSLVCSEMNMLVYMCVHVCLCMSVCPDFL